MQTVKRTPVLLSSLVVISFLLSANASSQELDRELISKKAAELHVWLESINAAPAESAKLCWIQQPELTGLRGGRKSILGLYLSQENNLLHYETLGLMRSRTLFPNPASAGTSSNHSRFEIGIDSTKALEVFSQHISDAARDSVLDEQEGHALAFSWLRLAHIIHRTTPQLDSRMHQLVLDNPSVLWRFLSKRGLETFISKNLMRQLHIDLSEPTFSWAQLKNRAEEFCKHFPDNRLTTHAKLLANKLSEMEAHEKKIASQALAQTGGDKIDKLILQLQNQSGTLMSSYQQFASPIDFHKLDSQSANGEKSDELNTAEQLVMIGLPAVPKLIESLHDDRFTRCQTSLTRNGYFRVQTVGECIVHILDAIAVGQSFTQHLQPTLMFDFGLSEIGEHQILDWWQEAQSLSELEYLKRKLASSSDWDTYDIAKTLIRKYPDESIAAIRNRLHPASYVDSAIVELISPKLEGGIDFLQDCLLDPSLETRVAAAVALEEYERETCQAIMIKEWKRLAAKPNALRAEKKRNSNGVVSLIAYLIRSNNSKMIDMLNSTFDQVDADTAYTIIANLNDVFGQPNSTYLDYQEPASYETRRAAIDLFQRALRDQRRRRSMRVIDDPDHNLGERICKTAAVSLWGSLPQDLRPVYMELNDNISAAESRQRIDDFVRSVEKATRIWKNDRDLKPAFD